MEKWLLRVTAAALPGPPHWLTQSGLIATDGNLSRDGRHMSVVSTGVDLLERRIVGRIQWGDRAFYDALLCFRSCVSLVSASRLFVDWIQATVQRLTGIIEAQHRKGRRVIQLLRYANRESLDLVH